ncbi:phage tail protein [Dyella terrae]|uniref:phage tail protein n=1 Tax=Dyella terrae TaxID=522259 RepID=UPI001EFC805C|nr:phage tail protein [Dyella terrae]ULU26584.1 phage tail protein [Dyella terrae]
MGSSKKQVVGYRYYLDWLFGLCLSLDELVTIFVDKKVAWTGSQTTSGRININAPNLLGGDKYEGGIVGGFDLQMGEATQVANDYLVSKLGPDQPAYRLRATGVYRGGQTGANTRSPRLWSFRGRRALSGWDGPVWYPQAAVIPLEGDIKAMNPAHIVYEACTNSLWGAGVDGSFIDLASFKAAADQLVSEGFGLSAVFDSQQTTAEAFVQRVCDHIGAVCGENRTTGLIELKLVRGGYDPSKLLQLTANDVIDITSYEASTATNSVNELQVTYHDPVTNTDRFVSIQALGSVQAQDGVIFDTADYSWIPTYGLAARVCQRDLRARSLPLGRLEAKFKRTARDLAPGDVFQLTHPRIGPSPLVFRVGDANYGTLTKGEITLTCVVDVFSMPDIAYVAEQTSGWVPPNPNPLPAPYQQLIEAPYRELVQVLGSSQAQSLPANAGYVGLLAVRPSTMAYNYQLWTSAGAAYANVGDGSWCPMAMQVSNTSEAATVIAMSGGIDLSEVEVGTALIIENEICRLDAFDPVAETATIARGCLDTIPAQHPAGAQVWFYDEFTGSDGTQYFNGETVNARALTRTSQGTLDINSAPTSSIQLQQRASRPYPPGAVQLNGASPWGTPAITGHIALSWAHRSRLLQDDQLIDTTAGNIGPDIGTTYNARIYDASNNLVVQINGIPGTSVSYVPSFEGAYRVELESQCNGLTSLQHYSINLTITQLDIVFYATEDGTGNYSTEDGSGSYQAE